MTRYIEEFINYFSQINFGYSSDIIQLKHSLLRLFEEEITTHNLLHANEICIRYNMCIDFERRLQIIQLLLIVIETYL